MKRRLPLGIQDFTKLRELGFVYVDKTERIYDLITESAGPVFLSRPRRFGKSLLCSTLAAIFEGRRELFGGFKGQPPLAIDSLDWDWNKHPVIHIDLNPGRYEDGVHYLDDRLHTALSDAAETVKLPPDGETPESQFGNLIKNMYRHAGQKTVVIIDEYDKPLLSTIDNTELHRKMRIALKSFYAILKSYDQYLKFVLLTGVTKFSQVSVFSELNSLTDISLNPDYYDICGITQEELETNFEPEISAITRETGQKTDEYLDKLKHFYNGYRFSEKPATVYNPFGLLNHFFNRGEFESYWFSTGTPTFLIKLIETQKIDILDIENKSFTLTGLQKFNVDNMDGIAVLYQSGYLTIVDYDERFKEYTLDYPNEEVRSAFANALLEHYVHVPSNDVNALAVRLPKALAEGDISSVMNNLIPFLAAIPYDITIKQEKYYQTVLHLIFRMLGLYCQSEVKIASGRIDTLVEAGDYIYCFEFKLDGTAEEALHQIDSRDYLLPWQGTGKKLVKVGVAFDYKKRNISEWKVQPHA
jgi:hypothetical protein